jgi:hypothetical protein
MTTPLSLIARKAEMAGLRAGLDAGGAGVLFYTGVPTALPDMPTAEVLLGSLPLASPCGTLGEAGTGPFFATLSITVPQVVLASATGVIGWVRFVDGAGNGFIDLLAGLEGSGAPVIVNATQVYAGGELRLVSCLIVK